MRRARGNGGRFLNTKKIDNGTPKGKADPKKGNALIGYQYYASCKTPPLLNLTFVPF
jgi:hypothetical protein